MPRRPRVVLPPIPLHLIQRGNNRQVCFVADEDYRFYLDWLKEFAGKTGCQLRRLGCRLGQPNIHSLPKLR
jgi:putative transposase